MADAGPVADASPEAATAPDARSAPVDLPPPPAFDQVPIYYSAGDLTFRVSLATRTPAGFGVPGPTVALVPSPSRQRVAQQLETGVVHVFNAGGQELGKLDARPALLGWIDEETVLFFDRGTAMLHRARIDGSERRDLPNPVQLPYIGLERAVLAPDGRWAAVVMERKPTELPSAARTLYVVSTADGSVVARHDVQLSVGPLWAQDGTLVWIDGDHLVRLPALDGAPMQTPLPFSPCSLRRWAGDRLRLGKQALRGGIVNCTEFHSITTDGRNLLPIEWLNLPFYNPTFERAAIAISPDGKKLVIDNLVGAGLNVVDPDGSGHLHVADPTGAVTAVAW